MACASGRTGLVGATIAVTIAAALGVAPPVTAQGGSAAETAARLTGHWKLNAELTPVSAKPGGDRGRSSFVVASAAVQRGDAEAVAAAAVAASRGRRRRH